MIVLFSLSQVVNVAISLYKYNKDFVTVFMEEETENTEEYKNCSDDKYYIFVHKMHPLAGIYIFRWYAAEDISIYISLSHQPETPPPNFC